MEDCRQNENDIHKMEYYRGPHFMWNTGSQHQVKEPNALVMNKKIRSIMAERQAVILKLELEAAISEKNALAAQDEAIQERDEALVQRDNAILERDNALAALQSRNSSVTFPFGSGIQCGSKRIHHSSNHLCIMFEAAYKTKDAFPITVIPSEVVKSHQVNRAKENKAIGPKASNLPYKVK
ncbi:hypothetical protein LR48_Vigan06g157800 [Vigna angularis]|uniref:GAGA-binding transcriptional activator n=1 Tax=Phaseolus angularis TaxID=3914 RepID=A0A0L9UUL1_PHAAN|nr:hypothetical protein LR48_Vigan06g157800 [Vigna angularis]